jgi:arylsulfatase A-like enzyme
MRGPGIPQGLTIDPLVTNADLAPTITDAANAQPGLTMDGRSLLRVIANPSIDEDRELLVEAPPRPGPNNPSFEAIRTERYTYAEHSSGERELYDLREDPFELRSLQLDSAYAGVRAKLAAELHRLEGCSGSGCLRTFRP